MSKQIGAEIKSRPASALVPPVFPGQGRLPTDPNQVSENIRKQKADETRFTNQQRKLLQSMGNIQSGPPCSKALHITIAFDGTNNNDAADSSSSPSSCSNIARIFHASLGSDPTTQTGYYRYCSPGVGTTFPEINEVVPDSFGLIGANGGENRINWGLTRLIAALKDAIPEQNPLSPDQTLELVEGMATSWLGTVMTAGLMENGEKKREAVMRPHIQDLEKELKKFNEADQKPRILAMRLYVYGFSRGAAQARTFANWLQTLTRCQGDSGVMEYRFAGLPLSIEFLGLCDTVAAVGLADSAPFAAGHMGWADDTMRLPEDLITASLDTTVPEDRHFLKRCVHLVSAHEQRASFPLDSIRRRPKKIDGQRDTEAPSGYRDNTVEYFYPGVHSDVGGGYSPKDQGKAVAGTNELLSQIPLHHLYAEAFKAGAPLQVPKEALLPDHEVWRAMEKSVLGEFDFSADLVRRFNAWQAQAKGGALEEVMKQEHVLITAWRIDRYAGGVEKQPFFQSSSSDMPKAKIDAWEAIQARRDAKTSAAAEGKPEPTYTEAEEKENQLNIQIVGGQEKVDKMRWEKKFEPPLDHRQLSGAAGEFRHDYLKEWGVVDDSITIGGVADMLLGGTVFLINEEDEAEEYAYLHDEGTKRYEKMFIAPNKPRPGQEDLVALFDNQVHDSRAWFMNHSAIGPREPFTDYFRIRLVHFDNESNKQLSLLVTAGRVIGVGIALASVGLSIKRKDPRMLLGLFLPSLARPVLSGKVGLPEISAFDPLTGIALPMLTNLDSLRSFTKEPGDMVAKVAALPALQPLTAANANTPALQKILVAHQAVEAARKKDASALASLVAKAANDEDKPGGWMDMVADQAGSLKSSEKNV
ncbi:DUF2235 domain-containing protein [Pseudomonas sp. ANT_J12]|uniref:T6SS phospholipase effector Tle1-like catalytic domain-containing protein n=1 Tax=Pseudomonas sp. ANT_J12 TaxID=2597351 RepID=UPI0011F2A6A1|nr:DUF2235 domain-containing protein [Pseudomonas sp. ANT_J12]KAA0988562.1 DUF2235 domain-containing protein [Pseudomonas sp. ANT_J12]